MAVLEKKLGKAIFAVFLCLFFIELIRTAWICDDAAITLRTVLNFVHGYGPTFNIDERVQAYTHPLWFLGLSALSLVLQNVFTATFVLSIGTSMLVLWVLFTRLSTQLPGALLGGAALLLSKAFVDFSTSGLENPLSHLLILATVLLAIKVLEQDGARWLAWFFTSCSLIYLNRPDLLAMVLPLAAMVALRHRDQPSLLIRALLLGATPALLWTVFSLLYYGFPFPNTAYAKLGAGIALKERMLQGLRYGLQTLQTDPITIAVIVAGCVIGSVGSALGRSLALGMVLYLLYVVSIGGDFMEGRFFTAPLLVAAVLLGRCELHRAWFAVLGASVCAMGMYGIHATLLSGSNYANKTILPNGIADERGFYYQQYGLLTASKTTFAGLDWSLGERKVLVTCSGLGFDGILAGPTAHYIDTCGLSDPLLARLPAKQTPNWRIGHFARQLPTDYKESVQADSNILADPQTRSYYGSIRTVTRGKLLTAERIREIWRLNLGRATAPDWSMYRFQEVPRSSSIPVVAISQLSHPLESGLWNQPGTVVFDQTLELDLGRERSFQHIDTSTDSNDDYKIEILVDGRWVEVARVLVSVANGLSRHRIDLPQATPAVRRVRISSIYGDDRYSVGHFIVN